MNNSTLPKDQKIDDEVLDNVNGGSPDTLVFHQGQDSVENNNLLFDPDNSNASIGNLLQKNSAMCRRFRGKKPDSTTTNSTTKYKFFST